MAVLTAVARIVLLFGCVLAFTTGGRAQDLPTVRVAGCSCDDFKTVYYGVRSGLFRRAGVNVEIVTVANGAAAMASVVGGSTQAALTSVVPLLQAHQHGVPFQIVSPAQWYLSDAATNMLFVRKDSTVRSGRDLNGKTLAVQSLKDLNSVATLAWIDKTGGDSRTTKMIELPLSAVAAAIDEGRVDAGSLQSPFFEQALASGKVRFLAKNYDAIGKRFEAAVYVSMGDYVNANLEVMGRFARAMHEAIVYVNGHLAETVDLVASYTGIDPAVVARSARTTDPEYLEARFLQPLIDISYKYKLIDRAFPADELFSSVLPRAPR